MTILDTKITAKALAAIKKYGRTATLVRVTKVQDRIEGTTNDTESQVDVYCSPPYAFDAGLVNGDTILQGDSKIIVSPEGLSNVAPKEGRDYLLIDGVRWSIILVTTHSPGTTVAAYELQIRRSV